MARGYGGGGRAMQLEQKYGGKTERSSSRNSSLLSLDNSASSVYSGPSLWTETGESTSPVPGLHHLHDCQPHPALPDVTAIPIWVELLDGLYTGDMRVSWALAKLKWRVDGHTETVPREAFNQLSRCELKPETSQNWLQKGLKFERLSLYQREFNGPAVQLMVARSHPHQGGAPFHFNHRGPFWIGGITLLQQA